MTGPTDTAKEMVDTNVLVYAYDTDAGTKHDRAKRLLKELSEQSNLIFSTQVLNEFYAVVTHPHRSSTLPHDEATQIVRDMAAAWDVVPLTSATTLRALDAIPQHGLSFWDALIWAAAKEHGITVIHTEDFQVVA